MVQAWQLEETDPLSGRKIYARQTAFRGEGYDFEMSRDFQVRDADENVLLQTCGTGKGEHWCGVFLFFIDGTAGAKVRLEESNVPENSFYDVPNHPIPKDKVWE